MYSESTTAHKPSKTNHITSTSKNVSKSFPVPDGFQELLSSLAKEVLRNQPSDVYSFCNIYFNTLLETRDVGGDPLANRKSSTYREFQALVTRKAHLHGLVGNDAYATKQFHFGNNEQNVQPALAASEASPTGLSPVPEDEALTDWSPAKSKERRYSDDQAATKIQSGVRGFLTRRKVERTKEQRAVAATKIQANFRGYQVRKDLPLPQGGVRSASNEELVSMGIESRPSSENLNAKRHSIDDSATLIQANVRGFLTRRRIDNEKQAATKIQATFRGFKTRKELEGRGLSVRSRTPSSKSYDSLASAGEMIENSVGNNNDKDGSSQ